MNQAATVVVSTYAADRFEVLRDCIQSLRDQTTPPAEIIVVVDRNPPLLRRVRRDFEGVVTVENDAFPGAGGARNTGLRRVTTPFVAFIDDDAEASHGWLENHLGAYADPLTIGTGGGLEPAWETGRPAWFPPEFDWVVGCTFEGMPAPGGIMRNPISANMTARTDALRAVGGFRPNFGKIGMLSLPEDTDLGIRVLGAFPGHHWRYRPAATARHRVPPERATMAYFFKRCWYEGTGKAQLVGHVGPQGLSSEWEYSRRALPLAFARALRDGAVNRDVDALRRAGAVVLGFVATASGYIVGRVRAT
jgi:GT2 family glycosyltransferase